MFILFYFIINIFVSAAIGKWSESKGKGFALGFMISFILSPIVGLIVIGIMQPNAKAIEERSINSGENKKCPFCGEMIKSEAIKCRFCSSDLPVAESKIESTQRLTSDAVLLCPKCGATETVQKNGLKKTESTEKFKVKYSGFSGSFKFTCLNCKKSYHKESHLL